MAHGLNTVIKSEIECNSSKPKNFHAMDQNTNGPVPPPPARPAATKMGSRRIFTPQFKLQVLESYRNDNDCKGNQRATARKYGIHRRQIQKWLQVENNLRSVVANSANHHQFHHSNNNNNNNNSTKQILLNNNNSEMMKIISTSTDTRHRVVVGSSSNNNMHKNSSTTKYMNKTQQYNNSSNLTNVGGFISPVLSYGCDQPAISFAHHPHHRISAPTPSTTQTHYESYESSSSASLSSPLQSSPNLSHYTPATTITNTCNNLMLSRNNGNSSSPVHLSHHPYPQVPTFVSPPLNSYPLGIIKPEPHLPVPSHHLLPPSHFIPEPHYYPAPVPCSTPLSMPLYPQVSPRQPRTHPETSEIQITNNMESAIDLSMPLHQKRIISSNKCVESRTPSPYDAKWVNVNNNVTSNATNSDAIDLTCKKRKHSSSDDENVATPPVKVPKLFKPYLLDEEETNNDDHQDTETINHENLTKGEGFKKNFIASDDGQHHRQKDAIIWNNHSAFSQYDSYRTPDFSPNSTISYASPPYTMSPYCEVPYHNNHHPPQSSPVSGYESSTSSIYSDESPPTGYNVAFKLQDVDNFNTFHSGRNSTMIYA